MLMRQLLRYASVGAAATVLHWSLLVLAVELLGWPAWVGSGVGAVAGAQLAYAGNRRYTFASDHSAAAWLRFQGTALLGGAWGMGVVAVAVALGLHYLLAQALATGSALLLTFVVNRLWTFKRPPPAAAPNGR
jgi:putative flippase GtrA